MQCHAVQDENFEMLAHPFCYLSIISSLPNGIVIYFSYCILIIKNVTDIFIFRITLVAFEY